MDSDDKLQRDLWAKIRKEVEFEPGDDTHFLNLAVFHGIATVKGRVSNYLDKMAVLKILEGEKGIIGWTDDLAIQIPEEHRRNDEEIAEAAREAISGVTTIPLDAIRIKVEDGWLYLEGIVEHWSQREAAEYAVQCLTGLRGLLNLIWAGEHRVPDAPTAYVTAAK